MYSLMTLMALAAFCHMHITLILVGVLYRASASEK